MTTEPLISTRKSESERCVYVYVRGLPNPHVRLRVGDTLDVHYQVTDSLTLEHVDGMEDPV